MIFLFIDIPRLQVRTQEGTLIFFFLRMIIRLQFQGTRGVLSRLTSVFCWYFNLVGMILIMLYCFFSFFSYLFGGTINGLCQGPLWGQGLARSEPRPTLHALSLDVRDARRSSTASRGWRLIGGVLELSSRCVKGILVLGGNMERGEGGGRKC